MMFQTSRGAFLLTLLLCLPVLSQAEVSTQQLTTSLDAAANFSKAADEAGAAAEIYIYPGAVHAFAQPLFNQGKTYDPVATSVAWLLAENFFERRLAE